MRHRGRARCGAECAPDGVYDGSAQWQSALGGGAPTVRMDTEIGYTAPTFAGLLTPYSGFRFSQDGTRGYRFGGRMEIGGLGNVSLEGLRDEASDAATHGVMLQGHLNW